MRRAPAHVEIDEQGCDTQQRQTEASMMLDQVRRCIRLLSEDQRAPLLLVSVEGLSYKEAAEVLKIPMGTLTSRLSRGRLALMALMALMDSPTLVDEQQEIAEKSQTAQES
ncbi:MAG: sigma factor-like helix-turn-helix DNA-binding protein [Amphritea sp.]